MRHYPISIRIYAKRDQIRDLQEQYNVPTNISCCKKLLLVGYKPAIFGITVQCRTHWATETRGKIQDLSSSLLNAPIIFWTWMIQLELVGNVIKVSD